jgi:hypothetical protein
MVLLPRRNRLPIGDNSMAGGSSDLLHQSDSLTAQTILDVKESRQWMFH